MPRRSDKIGPYFLIEKLGRGTFGEVWDSDQSSKLPKIRFVDNVLTGVSIYGIYLEIKLPIGAIGTCPPLV